MIRGNYTAFGQVRDNIIIESTWQGNFEPKTKETVSFYIYERMLQNNLLDVIKKYNMSPFEVLILSTKGT